LAEILEAPDEDEVGETTGPATIPSTWGGWKRNKQERKRFKTEVKKQEVESAGSLREMWKSGKMQRPFKNGSSVWL
jgi:hypothetical protein